MQNNPAISVIVPVYKAEAYLHKCVDSLLAQTFSDFEVLLVDDGSPDRSGEICDVYAKQDTRIRVFHKENGGVSSARQCGIDNARGEYTIHADPDDWVEPGMLEELYRKAKEENADMVICDYYVDIKRKTKYIKQRPTALNPHTVMRELFQQLHGSCCNKLVRRACYNEHNVKFLPELCFCEDLVFNICLLPYVNRLTYVPVAYYHYMQNVNPNSLVNNRMLSQNEQLMVILRNKMSKTLYDEVYPSLVCGLLRRAFELHVDDSDSFYRKYAQYLPYLKQVRGYSRIVVTLLIMSCRGFYETAYHMYSLLRKIQDKL